MDRNTILTFSVLGLLLITPSVALRGHSTGQQIDKKQCPTVVVKGPRKNKALKPISFRSQIKNFSAEVRPVFKWSVIGAHILEGDGSEVITVQAHAREVRATLVIENFPSGCQSNSDTIVTKITDIPTIHPPPVVSSIATSISSITRPCPLGTKSDTCLPTGNEVQLTASAIAPHPDFNLLFTWYVTVGRLRGEGNTITWDLSGVASGTYTVTVEVEYFELKAVGSARVIVADCADCKKISVKDAATLLECPSRPLATSRAHLRLADILH